MRLGLGRRSLLDLAPELMQPFVLTIGSMETIGSHDYARHFRWPQSPTPLFARLVAMTMLSKSPFDLPDRCFRDDFPGNR